MKARTYYLRTAKRNKDGRGDPIACIMSEVDREGSAIRYSIAAAHPQDEFSKSIGRKIAAGRLEMSPRILTGVHIPASGHMISRIIMGDIVQQIDVISKLSKEDIEEHFANKWLYHIPAKVGNAAKRWLKDSNKPKKSPQEEAWSATNLTAKTTANVSLIKHIVPLEDALRPYHQYHTGDVWRIHHGEIGATLSPIAALVFRSNLSVPDYSAGIDLDKGIILGMPSFTLSPALIAKAVAIMNEHRNRLSASQEAMKHTIISPGIQGVVIPTTQVQSHNIPTPPATTPDLPTNKNEHNRTQKPWGDGEYPNGKANGGGEPTTSPNKLSETQQRNYDYFQTQLPSLVKNTFVRGRFVVVAEMQIQRAFDKFGDAYGYALDSWKPDEFVIQEVSFASAKLFGGGVMDEIATPKVDDFLERMRAATKEQERIAKNLMPKSGVNQ